MTAYEIREHTAEVGFTAYGDSQAEAFANAGRAMFSLMTEEETCDPSQHETFQLQTDERSKLLYDFLDHLLYLRDVTATIYCAFDVALTEQDGTYTLEVTAKGCPMDAMATTLDVKAVTYSDMRIEETATGWELDVVLDV